MKRISQTLVLVLVLILLLSAIAAAQSEKTLVTTLAEDGRFTTLLSAITITETEQAFSEGHWTLFAPTDEAFAAVGLNAENIGSRLSLSETVDLLLYHAMNKELTRDDARKMLGDVTMANGWRAGLKWFSDSLWLNDNARVTETDIFTANGIIHVLDQVITPPWPRTEEAVAISLNASLEEAKLLKAEEAAGERAAGGASQDKVEQTVIGDLDQEPAAETVTIPAGSLLDVMVKDGRFTTYLEAVGSLDLVTPYTQGEWTLFAPTDAAFAALGIDAGNVAGEFSVGELADLLLYHALDQEVSVDKAKTMLGDVTMRNGQIAGLKFFAKQLWINDTARVIGPDIRATNGIIHAIDSVIERPWPRVEVIEIAEPAVEQPGNLPE